MTGHPTGEQLAAAAQALVSAPFRLHGRDAASGLDCIGVIDAAFRACGVRMALPNGYALRAQRLAPLERFAARLGLEETCAPVLPGDVLLLRPAPVQHHFAIATAPGRCVHAHAGLGRVVEAPLPPEWPMLGQWRLRPTDPA